MNLGAERDPNIGLQQDGATFTIPREPVRRRIHGIETFNVLRGGEYFFLPSLPALRWLADLGSPEPSAASCNDQRREFMTGFDYDVLIIGSGFGIPKTQWDLPGFLWFPGAELYGVQVPERSTLLVSRRGRPQP
jgi:hypothetical protein